jgi:hypothetical protein
MNSTILRQRATRGIRQSLRAETFFGGILTRKLRNSHVEATILLWGARMAGLSETPESRMPKALLIVVVEDDRFFRDSMRSLMRSLGYTVEAFSSAADFLASPHLIETACPAAGPVGRGGTGRSEPGSGGGEATGRANQNIPWKPSSACVGSRLFTPQIP